MQTIQDKIGHFPRQLEDESIYILREVAAQFERPALLFSGGKDSITLVRLAQRLSFQVKYLSLWFISIPDIISQRRLNSAIG